MNRQQILESKILIPDTQKDYVQREKLLSKLQGENGKLLVLCASMGYGKTVLMSQYAGLPGYISAWYHLDSLDNEFLTFVRYLILSFDKALGGFKMAESVCLDVEKDTAKEFGRKLSRELNNCIKGMEAQKLVLVLDNFQVLENPIIFYFLEELLCHTDQRFLMAVATKKEVPDPLAKYMVRHQTMVMGPESLSFEETEVKTILERMLSKEETGRYEKSLWENTKGWPAGVMLSALYLKRICGQDFDVKWEQVSQDAFIDNYMIYELFRSYLNSKAGEELKRSMHNRIAGFYKDFQSNERPEEDQVVLEKQLLSVSCFGKFRVVLLTSGREISWRTHKAMELFAYLVDLEGKPVERQALLELLWPDNAPMNEVAMLHNMIYSIRKELSSQPELAGLIQYKKHQYRLDVSLLKMDLDSKKQICRLAELGKGKELYEHRDELLDNWGVYLKDVDGTWCISRRTYFERTYGKACTILADYCRKMGDYETEAACWSAYMNADRYSEKAVAGLLCCYAEMGERNQMKRIYQYAKKVFQGEMETELSPEIIQIYKEGIKKRKK